jgi:hypothetical protein
MKRCRVGDNVHWPWSLSDVDPEDDGLEDSETDPGDLCEHGIDFEDCDICCEPEDDLDANTEGDLDEDGLCEHGLDWDECDDCSDDGECPHGFADDEHCPTCDTEELRG